MECIDRPNDFARPDESVRTGRADERHLPDFPACRQTSSFRRVAGRAGGLVFILKMEIPINQVSKEVINGAK